MGNVSISVMPGSHFELLISISLLYITLSNKDIKSQAVGWIKRKHSPRNSTAMAAINPSSCFLLLKMSVINVERLDLQWPAFNPDYELWNIVIALIDLVVLSCKILSIMIIAVCSTSLNVLQPLSNWYMLLKEVKQWVCASTSAFNQRIKLLM